MQDGDGAADQGSTRVEKVIVRHVEWLLVLEIEEADKRLDENLGSLVAYDFSEGSPLVPRPSESIHTWSVRQAACLAKLKIDSAATGARRRAGPFLVDRI